MTITRPRLAGVCAATCLLAFLAACSSDDSGEQTPNLTPFGFLAGKYGVGVSPGFANCAGEVFFPQEMWLVSTYLASVSLMPFPDPSSGPQPVNGTSPQDTGSEQTIPPSFSAVMGSTLHWSASHEELSTTEEGCMKRRTTVLDLQFTPDGNFAGTRSVFNEYAGGADCPASCRMHFEVQASKLPQ
jgi:hypothetical protein